jgi:hypothetical protein
MAYQPQGDGWLAENGPKELELLFRAFVFHPSEPILLADNDRRYLEAGVLFESDHEAEQQPSCSAPSVTYQVNDESGVNNLTVHDGSRARFL